MNVCHVRASSGPDGSVIGLNVLRTETDALDSNEAPVNDKTLFIIIIIMILIQH